jgi:hypothetical protein
MLNPDKKHKPQVQGLEQQINTPGLYYKPQPLRCTHHFQLCVCVCVCVCVREREREWTDLIITVISCYLYAE